MGIEVCEKCGVILWCSIAGMMQMNDHNKKCPLYKEGKKKKK